MPNKIKNFKTLITCLCDEKIEYAVLGKTITLDQLVEGDIDIVISRKDFKTIEKTIENYCFKNNQKFIQNIQHESVAKYLILADKEDHSILCPDFCYDYVRDKRFLLGADELLANKTTKTIDGFKINILESEYEFVYYFLKKIDKVKLPNPEYNHLQEQYRFSDNSKIDNLLKEYFSRDSIQEIHKIFAESNINSFNQKLIILFRKDLHRHKNIKINYFLSDLFLKMNRILYKTGLSITIMGSDGCGKSTVIDGISKNLKPCFRKVNYYHLKPINSKISIADTTNPQGQQPYSFLKSILKLFYLLSQYNFGFIKIHKNLIKSTLIIFDRYYEDILIDSLRFRYGAPIWIAKFIGFFIPKPKIYILLDAKAEIIYKRKQELSVLEIDRQRLEYQSLFKNKKNRYIIDTSKKIEDVIFNVEEVILSYLEQRQKKRF